VTLSPDLAAVGFGLASAISWGAGDFSGGLATKRANVFGVTIFSQLTGLILFVIIAFLRGETPPSLSDALWAVMAGWGGVFGLIAFYRALAKGRMGVVAPVAAVVTAAVPVIVGTITQGLPAAPQLIGFVFAMVGVWFISRPEGETSGRPDGLGLAIIAGIGFGSFLVLIHQVTEGHVFWPLAVARSASLILMIVIASFTQRAWIPRRGMAPLIALCGILDAGGNALFVIAGQLGRLDVASILSSLYPASTVMLAAIILKERLNRLQQISILFVLVAIVLIAAKQS
jgi:drug/metabolite transporter (DMT)-like permease